jgi:hypothetical protein
MLNDVGGAYNLALIIPTGRNVRCERRQLGGRLGHRKRLERGAITTREEIGDLSVSLQGPFGS